MPLSLGIWWVSDRVRNQSPSVIAASTIIDD
jgi:hypothetical protein